MPNKLPKALYVEWVDALADSGWTKLERVSDIHRCHSIGFLVKETKNSIVLATAVALDEDGNEANSTLAIPKAWIKKRRVLKV